MAGKKRKVTLDALALSTQREFLGVNKRMDRIERHMSDGFQLLARAITNLEARLGDFKRDMIAAISAIHDQEVDELKRRVDRLEKKVGI